MANLVAFGCSFTFGHGLQDCFDPITLGPGLTPSKDAWPCWLSKIGKLTCINQSECGISNFDIALRVLNYDFNKGDVCSILWSFLNRDVFIHPDSTIETISHWQDETKFRNWTAVNTQETMNLKFWFNLTAIDSWLKTHNVPVIHAAIEYRELINSRPNWARDINFLEIDTDNMFRKHPLALDNGHPGVGFHREFAETIAKKLNWN